MSAVAIYFEARPIFENSTRSLAYAASDSLEFETLWAAAPWVLSPERNYFRLRFTSATSACNLARSADLMDTEKMTLPCL